VPAFHLAGRGPAPLGVRGHATIDAARAIELARGLPFLAEGPLKALEGAGAASVSIQADGLLPGSGLDASLLAAADLEGVAVGFAATEASVDRVRPFVAFDLKADGRHMPLEVRAAGVLRAEGMAGPSATALESLEADTQLAWDWSRPTVLRAAGGASLSDLAAHPALPPLSLSLGAELAADAVLGNVTANSFEVTIPHVARLAATDLSLTGFGGGGVSGTLAAELPDLGKLAELVAGALPAELSARMPSVSGRASASAELGGRLPLIEDAAAALMQGKPPPMPRPLPLRAFFRDSAPLHLKAHLKAEEVGVILALSQQAEAGVRGLLAEATAELAGNDVSGSLSLTLPEAVFTPSPVPLTDFRADARADLRAFDALSLTGELSGLGGVLTANGALNVEGLSRLPLPPSPADALRLLALSAHADGALRPGEVRLHELLSAQGEMGMALDASLEPGRSLQIALEPRLRDFSAGWGTLFSVRGLDGGFGFAKQWRIAETGRGEAAEGLSRRLVTRPAEEAGPGTSTALPEFGTAVDELMNHAGELRLAAVSALGARIVEGFSVRMAVEGATFLAPRFYMRLLGGRTVGMLRFAPAEGGRELRTQGEFGAVDLRRLLPPELRDFSGDSRVSGNFSLSALLSSDPSRSRLKDVSARLDLTHIGPAALGRLLLALDPRSENPSLVRVRRALSLASPSGAHAVLRRGFLSGTVELRGAAGRLVSEYSVPPFNIAGLFGVQAVDAALSRLAPAMKALNLLDTTRIELGPGGRVRFR